MLTKQLTFQTDQLPDFTMPYPVIIDEAGAIVYGRHDAKAVIGFHRENETSIALYIADAMEEPEKVLGLIPTYIGDDGLFTTTTRVISSVIHEIEVAE